MSHRRPILKTTDHRKMAVKKPTTDQITILKPPTTDHIANMLYLVRDFSAITILWCLECPHMNGAGLNFPSSGNGTILPKAREAKRVIKIGRTSILNNEGMVACGFL